MSRRVEDGLVFPRPCIVVATDGLGHRGIPGCGFHHNPCAFMPWSCYHGTKALDAVIADGLQMKAGPAFLGKCKVPSIYHTQQPFQALGYSSTEVIGGSRWKVIFELEVTSCWRRCYSLLSRLGGNCLIAQSEDFCGALSHGSMIAIQIEKHIMFAI